ncbi:hypothetical protein Pint_03875 [Pistacia integerrima]|uniref:Uncharacterized protein n=1 Tax=Pistacia integerrima TaxID=434235 RepID=A0ACC0Z404_9ROSI|nr:hypothetical protein Pint_03875 [Pistacia integerrima]
MDYQSHEHQNQKTLSHQFTKTKFLKQVTKLLLSVSVFSLFFSHSTWFSLAIKLISHNLDKNYIFLLCNGLLVCLAKFSGLLSSSSSSNYSSSSSSSSSYKHSNNLTNEYYNNFKHYEDESRSEGVVMEAEDKSVMEKERGDELMQSVDQTTEANADHQAVKGESEEVEQEVAEETKYVIEEEDHEEESNKEAEAEAETQADFDFRLEAEEEREQNGMLSTEELNKKFEDFIRKMKEELRIEARQQLVMV